MGFDMTGANDTQSFAGGKPDLRRSTRVTAPPGRGSARGMPEMSPEARSAYPEERVKAAIRAVRAERDVSWLEWSKRAGVSDGSVRGFAESPPGGKERSMLLSAIMRLAWAANVSVARLIGEAEPTPAETPPPDLVEQLQREIELTAVAQDLRGQMLALHQKILELERGLQAAQRERDALRQQIAEIPPRG